ncbi:MAG: hypothetical protein WC609_03340 [Candidatus Paceibacterota bacterium]|jgi:hypothetical protein
MREISGLRVVFAGLFLVGAFLTASCGEIPMRDYTTTEVIAIIVFTAMSVAATFRIDEAIMAIVFGRKRTSTN